MWAGRDDRLANHWQIRGAANTGRGGVGPANGKATASTMVAIPWRGGKPHRPPRAVQLPPGTEGCGLKTRPPSRGEHGVCMHEIALVAQSVVCHKVPRSMLFLHMCSHHLLSCCDCSSSNKYMVREFLCGTPGCGNERCHDLTLSLSPGLLEAIQPRRPTTGIWCFARSSGVLMLGGSTPSPDKLMSFAFPGNLNTIYGCRLAARWPDKLSFAFQGSLTKESVWGSGSVWAGRDDRLANHWQIRGAANTGRGGFGPANGKATASAMVAIPVRGQTPQIPTCGTAAAGHAGLRI